MQEKVLYKINISGRVQGVGFRYNAAKEARNRGITGIVKNLSNGEVYIEAEGLRDDLSDFVEWCKKGPAFAYVESVNVDSFPPEYYDEFRIEH